jgi:acyl-CoA reductase-like NAD-dependent aldehyde dehydrogenase
VQNAVLAALVDCLVFIEQSSDEVIDADAAVQAVEDVSARLAALPPSDRGELVARLSDLALEAEPPRREFIERLPEALGLKA